MIRFLLVFSIVSSSALGSGAAQQAEVSQQPIKVSSQIIAARLLRAVPPKRVKIPKCSNAMVTLDVIIGEDGTVQSLKVVGGWQKFTESAIPAVKRWTYRPYLLNGVATAVETEVLVFYPSTGNPGPLFVPDGQGGVKGGKFHPMPTECADRNK
jgi:protein TonB